MWHPESESLWLEHETKLHEGDGLVVEVGECRELVATDFLRAAWVCGMRFTADELREGLSKARLAVIEVKSKICNTA